MSSLTKHLEKAYAQENVVNADKIHHNSFLTENLKYLLNTGKITHLHLFYSYKGSSYVEVNYKTPICQ